MVDLSYGPKCIKILLSKARRDYQNPLYCNSQIIEVDFNYSQTPTDSSMVSIVPDAKRVPPN